MAMSMEQLLLRLKRVFNKCKLERSQNAIEKAIFSIPGRFHLGSLKARMEQRLFERQYQDLQEAYLDTIHRLVLAVECKDPGTGSHIARMSQYSVLIAEKLSLSDEEIQLIHHAAPMHDVGKIGIPDHILLKRGRLTPSEFEVMKEHTLIGAKILANSKSKILAYAQCIAMTHHEKWNGQGYPYGLKGEDIPLPGRIVALADVFDALVSVRPYREAYSVDAAIEIIRQSRGCHFDPKLTDIFLDNLDEVLQIHETISPTQNPLVLE